jgi:GxxExxY protein
VLPWQHPRQKILLGTGSLLASRWCFAHAVLKRGSKVIAMKHKELSGKVIDCAYKVHKGLGFGFLESVYHNALLHELKKAGLKVQKEQPIRVLYDGQVVGDFVADIIVENSLILELKSVQELHPAHHAQVNNYLKATSIEIGLLINFGQELEIKRVVNSLPA